MLCLLLSLSYVLVAQQSTPDSQNGTAIQILEGDGAINSIRLHRGHDPSVRIVSSAGEPISGATVTFLLPSTGPSATFGGNGLSTSAVTDDHGIATGRGLRPNAVAGQFRIRITTSWHGSPAMATLVQVNAEPVIRSGNSKKIAIIVLIAGAAAGGAAAALGHQSGSPAPASTTAGPTTSGSIVPGSPTIGPPH